MRVNGIKKLGITLVSAIALCGIGVTASANSIQNQRSNNTPVVKTVNTKVTNNRSSVSSSNNSSNLSTNVVSTPGNLHSNQNQHENYDKNIQERVQPFSPMVGVRHYLY